MPLPNGQQYNEAIQHPSICFTDNVLRGGTIEKLPPFNIMPKPYSGGFTSTYKVITPNGNWAVRCFTKDVNELQRRYQAYSQFYNANQSRFFVEADCLPSGILVNGNRYPIIKMKWLEGKSLNSYIESNLGNSHLLTNILTQLKNLVSELERLGVAHGDLQHGNILVKNNELFLIDYDDIYLPSLQGLTSSGVGHINYQHPQRTGSFYDKSIDRFSSIVIFLALKAVIAKPSLWDKYTNDDNIIFKQEDFRNYNSSSLLTEISSISNEFSTLVNRFRQLCNSSLSTLPTLQNFIDGRLNLQATTGTVQARNQYTILDGRQRAILLQNLGQRVEVVCKISEIFNGRTYNHQPYHFLNVGNYRTNTISFTVVLWSNGLAALRASNMEPSFFLNRWIKITGVLSSYQNRPNITLDNPRQIEFFETEQEAIDRLNNRTTGTKPTANPIPQTTQPVQRHSSQSTRSSTPTSIDSPFATLSTQRATTANTKPKSVTSTPSPTPKPATTTNTYKPASYSSTTNQTTKTTSSSSSSSDNSGCAVPIIFAIIGAALIGAASDGKLWFLGAIIGGFVGLLISNAFKS